MSAPRFSVIIVTCNRRRTLELCLGQIARQAGAAGGLEVLVVDDGSTDGTPEWLASSRWPFDLRPLRTGNSAETFGVMRARNIALLHARGEQALFLDDDMILHANAIAALSQAHALWEERGAPVAVRGWFGQRRSKGTFKLWLRALSLERYRPERERRRSAAFQALDARRDDLEPRQAPIGMLSVPRQAALAVDGFPEQAAVWGMDYEFQSRLKEKAGVRFVFEPRAYALHGPLRGDMTNKAYRKPLLEMPQGPRRGLSAYAGEDLTRYALVPTPAATRAAAPPAATTASPPPAPPASILPPMAGG
jgi:glycosyltransferase involved in cell wall biosynthesis